ncbi:methyl-accepting chemotaxis protein [uncultured Desulfovibrio sp.]|uniref:methyl-accepting chemotaxis protein n=1 Tax=uncultured Desulfovibrio sp. TaxID=167968 RepID=UPI0026242C4F|nr:methyl-accepting chemotaxis protein [uncultured Desulfovibrio sp.]
MARLSFKSVNTVLATIISIVLLIGVSSLVIYVGKSSYNVVNKTSVDGMKIINNGLIANVNDLIDANMSMIKVPAQSGQAKKAIEGDRAEMDALIKALVKEYKGINSIYVLNAQGIAVSGASSQGESFIGNNYGDRSYFKIAMQGKDAIDPDIIVAKTTKKEVLAIATPVFGENGKPIGAVCVTINWLEYIKSHVFNITVASHGYAFIIDANGRVIAHPNADTHMSDVSKLEFVVKALKIKNGSFDYEFQGKDKVIVFQTIERTGWLVCTSAFTDDLAKDAIEQRNILILVAIGIFVVLLGSIVFMVRRIITAPLKNIMDYSAQIAHGDFKATLTGNYSFELAELAGNFKEMTAVLKNRLGFADGVLQGITFPTLVADTDVCITYVNDAMVKLVGKSGKPADYKGMTAAEFFYGDASKRTICHKCLSEEVNAHGIEAEMTFADGQHKKLRIDASLIRDLDGNIVGAVTLVFDLTEIKKQQATIEQQRDAVAQVAQNANAIADRLSTATEELSTQVEQASRGADQQTQRVSETATAMEQMNASVLEVARNAGGASDTTINAKRKAEHGAEVVNKVVQGINQLHTQAMGLKTGMASLGDQAQSIGQIMTVISDIADQTNLLALNAAIEAARAGEAGRGFAVVADEVRKLAEKTMQATREVGSAIQGIQNGTTQNIDQVNQTVDTIEQTTELAGTSGEALSEIVVLVDQAADQAHSIAAAAEEQSATSDEINRAVEQINTISSETASAMSQSANAVTELAKQAQELKKLIAQMVS